MSLLLNEEQQFLKDTSKEFLQKNAPISHFRDLRDSKDENGYSKEIWKKMAELGWAGILVSEKYGGSEFGMMGLGGIFSGEGAFGEPPFNLTKSTLVHSGMSGMSRQRLSQ